MRSIILMPEITQEEFSFVICLLWHWVTNRLMGQSCCLFSHEGLIATFLLHYAGLFGSRAEASVLWPAINLSSVYRHHTMRDEVHRSFNLRTSTHFFPFLTRVVQCLSMPMCDLLIRACKRERLLIFAAGKSAIVGIDSFAIAGVTVA